MSKSISVEGTTVIEASPKQIALADLEAAKVQLAEMQGALAAVQAQIAGDTVAIEQATSVEEAQKHIADRASAQALISEWYEKQIPKQEAVVAGYQKVVNVFRAQEQIVVASAKREDNQIAIAGLDTEIKATMVNLSSKVVELASRYSLLKSQMQSLQSLAAAGGVAPVTSVLPVIQDWTEIQAELLKFNTLDWKETPTMREKIQHAPTFKLGGD